MGVVDFLSDEKLIEYLDKKVKDILNEHKIYAISSYGWFDQDTENPEYIGHAMWQTEPPNNREIEELIDGKPVSLRPTDIEKVIASAGEDFYGLMDISRLSIGLCIFFQSHAMKNIWGDNHYFWLHHIDAMMQLSIASGRIREFLIASIFKKTKNEFKETHKNKGGHYTRPFIEAFEIHTKNKSQENLISALEKTIAIAYKIYEYRKHRNDIVHKISTKIGKINLDIMDQFQKDYDRLQKCEKPIYREAQIDETPKLAEESETIQREEILDAVNVIKDWYKDLARLSSYVFEAEYWYRVKNRH